METLHQINQRWDKQTRVHQADVVEEPGISQGVPAKDTQLQSGQEQTSGPKLRDIFQNDWPTTTLSTEVMKTKERLRLGSRLKATQDSELDPFAVRTLLERTTGKACMGPACD